MTKKSYANRAHIIITSKYALMNGKMLAAMNTALTTGAKRRCRRLRAANCGNKIPKAKVVYLSETGKRRDADNRGAFINNMPEVQSPSVRTA